MTPFTRLTGRMVPLPARNVDTDQIIPARFLKTTVKSGLGEALFNDWRANDPNFILNQPRASGAQILVAGDNFGCGSSREHAPWALAAFGFRAVVSTSFGDIFRNNSLKNGFLPVQLDAAPHAALMERSLSDPAAEITIDLESGLRVRAHLGYFAWIGSERFLRDERVLGCATRLRTCPLWRTKCDT